MNIYNYFNSFIKAEIKELQLKDKLPLDSIIDGISVDPPRQINHGDLACNAAMVLAKKVKLDPISIAKLISKRIITHSDVEKVDIAGPGFLNITLKKNVWHDQLRNVLKAGEKFGDSEIGKGKSINVEYVSANPTGPLHVGHARGAVFGDVLSSLLEKTGYEATREYYINDAGAQIDILARSLYRRYCEKLGQESYEKPEGFYPGEYLIDLADKLVIKDKKHWLDKPESEWLPELSRYTVDEMMKLIRKDLSDLGIEQSTFISEKSIVERGMVDTVLNMLDEKGLIYTGVLEPPKGMKPESWEERPQKLFRSTSFGDDIDRPLKKSDDSWTYFASDLAYHLDKYKRGFTNLINVWGADHGGYIKRVQAGINALTEGNVNLDIKLCQLVRLLENGEAAKMSKRAGTYVTISELVDYVGRDVVRFIMLTRKNDAQLDFDIIKAQEQSRDNPVFYVQYAHARSYSVERMAKDAFNAQSFDYKNLHGSFAF